MSFNYTPRVQTIPTLEQITIPNKNIQSYFMKNDPTYSIKEEYKFQNYKKEDDKTLIICLLNDKIIIGDSITQNKEYKLNDFYYLSNFNTKKFHLINQSIDFLEKIISEIFKSLNVDFKSCFISLCFNDFLNRAEICSLINLFLNTLHFKGIILVPFSLAVCIGNNTQNAIVVSNYEKYSSMCFIEDNCLLDGSRLFLTDERNTGFTSLDTEDFVEEFNKNKLYENNCKRISLCTLCDFKEESNLKITQHLKDTHVVKTMCECGVNIDENEDHLGVHIEEIIEELKEFESENTNDNLLLMIKKNLTSEKIKKFGVNVILISDKNWSEEELDGELKEINPKVVSINEIEGYASAFRGATIISNLECSKEMWMTDKEWQNFGLRSLKEKVLFLI